MKNAFGQFDEVSYAAFMEAATEYYDFGACKSGEKMTFGKCQPTKKTATKSQDDFKKKAAASRKSKAEANLKKYPPGHKLHTQAKRELARG